MIPVLNTGQKKENNCSINYLNILESEHLESICYIYNRGNIAIICNKALETKDR